MAEKLASSHIDIWWFALNHPNWDDLSQEEVVAAKSFYQQAHQNRFVSGRSTLKAILKQYVDLPNRVSFDKNAYGKLHLNAYPKLQFNLSHSKEHALVAVGYEYPVGIDLEHHQGVDIFELGAMLYSPHEMAHLKSFPKSMQQMVFFNLWSQKEAFIKAIGMGLSYPTQQFSTRFGIRHMQTVQDWKIYSWMPLLDCSAAICMHSSIQTMSASEWINPPSSVNRASKHLSFSHEPPPSWRF